MSTDAEQSAAGPSKRARRTTARSYGPLAVVAAAFVLMAAAVPPLEREEQAFAGNVEVPSVGGPSATTPAGAPADPGAAGPEGTAPGAADPRGTGGGPTGGTGGEQSPNAGVAPCPAPTLQVPGDPSSPPPSPPHTPPVGH